MRPLPGIKKDYLDYPGRAGQRPAHRHRDHRGGLHIVKDRIDITGARWGLEGAEAILKLRALTASPVFSLGSEDWAVCLT